MLHRLRNNQTVRPHSTDLRENEIHTIVPFFPPYPGPEVAKITIVGLSTDLTSPNVDVDDIMNYPPKTKYKIFQELNEGNNLSYDESVIILA